MGGSVYANVAVNVLLTILTLIFQERIMMKLTSFSLFDYWRRTIVPSLITTVVAFFPFLVLRHFMPDGGSLVLEIVLCGLSLFWVLLCTFLLGLNRRERVLMLNYVRKMICRLA